MSKPASPNERLSRDGICPVHTRGPSGRSRRNTSVVVNWVASLGPVRSSTARIDETRGPCGVRTAWTTTSIDSLTSEFRALIGSSEAVSLSWQMNRNRVSA